MENQTIAFFDFDGTLTTKDSFIEAIKFIKGKFRFYIGFTVLSPILLLYKAKLIPNWKAKEAVLTYFFNGMRLADFQTACNQFAESQIKPMLRKEAIEKLRWHQSQGHRIVVVSASAQNWLIDWTQKLNVELIGTLLEVKNDKVTGKLQGNNCYGAEKAIRIKQTIDLQKYTTIYAYGDTTGDKEMLALATHPFYRKFN